MFYFYVFNLKPFSFQTSLWPSASPKVYSKPKNTFRTIPFFRFYWEGYVPLSMFCLLSWMKQEIFDNNTLLAMMEVLFVTVCTIVIQCENHLWHSVFSARIDLTHFIFSSMKLWWIRRNLNIYIKRITKSSLLYKNISKDHPNYISKY